MQNNSNIKSKILPLVFVGLFVALNICYSVALIFSNSSNYELPLITTISFIISLLSNCCILFSIIFKRKEVKDIVSSWLLLIGFVFAMLVAICSQISNFLEILTALDMSLKEVFELIKELLEEDELIYLMPYIYYFVSILFNIIAYGFIIYGTLVGYNSKVFKTLSIIFLVILAVFSYGGILFSLFLSSSYATSVNILGIASSVCRILFTFGEILYIKNNYFARIIPHKIESIEQADRELKKGKISRFEYDAFFDSQIEALTEK